MKVGETQEWRKSQTWTPGGKCGSGAAGRRTTEATQCCACGLGKMNTLLEEPRPREPNCGERSSRYHTKFLLQKRAELTDQHILSYSELLCIRNSYYL